MITYSIIKKSQLEGALRLDAEYYQPEYLDLANRIRKNKNILLKNCVEKLGRGNQPFYDEFGKIPVIKSAYVRDGFIEENLKEFIGEDFYLKNKKSQIKKYDILLNSTGVGTLGRSSCYFYEDKALVDGHVTIIRSNKINPLYLNSFLRSYYGQFQINRLFSGSSGQIEIYPDDIGLIEIFEASDKQQKDIAKLYENSFGELENSKLYYKQAENLLLKELGLENFEKETEKSLFNIVNFSEIKKTRRIDAEYFQSKYEKIISIINKNNGEKLGNIVSLKKGFEPGSEEYQEEGKLFIRVSSLSIEGIEGKDQKYLSDELFDKLRKDFQPKIGEILLTKDATPGIAYVLKENIDGIISGGIVRLIMKDKNIEPEYLALCINSILGQMQTKRDAGGSVIAHWKPEQIKNLLISILPKNTQEKISELVKKSHEARKKAKELLEEAKKKVEDLIENQ